MKKGLVILLITSLLFLNLFIISVHAVLEDTAEGLEKNVEDIENTKANIETKWDYLGKEWKNILLKNKFVGAIDGFFKKISFVFEVLIAEPYTFSVTFLVVVLLWLYLFLKFAEIVRDYSTIPSGVSYLVGLGFTLVLAHIGVIRKITEFLGWIVFKPEAWWARWIIIIILGIILILIYKFTSLLGKSYKKDIEKLEKEQEKLDRKTLKYLVNFLIKRIKSGAI